jgi:hypothetical protein
MLDGGLDFFGTGTTPVDSIHVVLLQQRQLNSFALFLVDLALRPQRELWAQGLPVATGQSNAEPLVIGDEDREGE